MCMTDPKQISHYQVGLKCLKRQISAVLHPSSLTLAHCNKIFNASHNLDKHQIAES